MARPSTGPASCRSWTTCTRTPSPIGAWAPPSTGIPFEAEATITNIGGDLTATITFRDPPGEPFFGEGVFTCTGTHEPTAGLVALAPVNWITEWEMLALLGMTGTFDPATKRLTGKVVGFANGGDQTLLEEPVTLDLVDGPGAPTVRGDEGNSLVVGGQNYTGTAQCSGPVREAAGTIEYDGAGGVSGTISLGDPALAMPLGTFAVTGVHNPSTGGLTLVPGLWTETDDTKKTFFVDGTYDPTTKKFDGDMLTNAADCPTNTWKATFE